MSESSNTGAIRSVALVAFLGLMVGAVCFAAFGAGRETIAPTSTSANWNVFVPKECANDALGWTSGKSHFADMPIADFLKLKREVEGCGGRVALAAPPQG